MSFEFADIYRENSVNLQVNIRFLKHIAVIVFVAAAADDDDDYNDDDDENDTTPMTTAEGVIASVNVCCFVFATFKFSLSLKRFFSSAGHSQSRDLRHDICCDEEFAENVPLFGLLTALSAKKRKRLVSSSFCLGQGCISEESL